MADLIERDALLKDMKSDCPESDVCIAETSCIECIIGRQTAVNRWIPCSERLPEDNAKCLAYTSDKRICIARWHGEWDEQGAWYIISDEVPKLYRIKNIPFWMPLPEPPEV